MKQQTIKISGMSCSNCADMIAENLSHLNGVHNVNVDLEDDSATVTYKSGQVATDDFKQTIETTGYNFEGVI